VVTLCVAVCVAGCVAVLQCGAGNTEVWFQDVLQRVVAACGCSVWLQRVVAACVAVMWCGSDC